MVPAQTQQRRPEGGVSAAIDARDALVLDALLVALAPVYLTA